MYRRGVRWRQKPGSAKDRVAIERPQQDCKGLHNLYYFKKFHRKRLCFLLKLNMFMQNYIYIILTGDYNKEDRREKFQQNFRIAL